MTILSCRTGLTSLSEDSLPLFIVAADRFDDFIAARTPPQQHWARTTGFIAKAGHHICLPDQDGQMACAAVLTGPSAVWDITGAATSLPAGSWAPDLSFAEQTQLSDIQLGWGLGQYLYAPHKQDDRDSRLPLLALAEE